MNEWIMTTILNILQNPAYFLPYKAVWHLSWSLQLHWTIYLYTVLIYFITHNIMKYKFIVLTYKLLNSDKKQQRSNCHH